MRTTDYVTAATLSDAAGIEGRFEPLAVKEFALISSLHLACVPAACPSWSSHGLDVTWAHVTVRHRASSMEGGGAPVAPGCGCGFWEEKGH